MHWRSVAVANPLDSRRIPQRFHGRSNAASARWSLNFIHTYLERGIPQFRVRVPAGRLQRFWSMLAHRQGGLLNASELARNLGVLVPAVPRYVDLLSDLMQVRRLTAAPRSRPLRNRSARRTLDTARTFRGTVSRLHHTPAGLTTPGLDGRGLRDHLPAGPPGSAWYPVLSIGG